MDDLREIQSNEKEKEVTTAASDKIDPGVLTVNAVNVEEIIGGEEKGHQKCRYQTSPEKEQIPWKKNKSQILQLNQCVISSNNEPYVIDNLGGEVGSFEGFDDEANIQSKPNQRLSLSNIFQHIINKISCHSNHSISFHKNQDQSSLTYFSNPLCNQEAAKLIHSLKVNSLQSWRLFDITTLLFHLCRLMAHYQLSIQKYLGGENQVIEGKNHAAIISQEQMRRQSQRCDSNPSQINNFSAFKSHKKGSSAFKSDKKESSSSSEDEGYSSKKGFMEVKRKKRRRRIRRIKHHLRKGCRKRRGCWKRRMQEEKNTKKKIEEDLKVMDCTE